MQCGGAPADIRLPGHGAAQRPVDLADAGAVAKACAARAGARRQPLARELEQLAGREVEQREPAAWQLSQVADPAAGVKRAARRFDLCEPAHRRRARCRPRRPASRRCGRACRAAVRRRRCPGALSGCIECAAEARDQGRGGLRSRSRRASSARRPEAAQAEACHRQRMGRRAQHRGEHRGHDRRRARRPAGRAGAGSAAASAPSVAAVCSTDPVTATARPPSSGCAKATSGVRSVTLRGRRLERTARRRAAGGRSSRRRG